MFCSGCMICRQYPLGSFFFFLFRCLSFFLLFGVKTTFSRLAFAFSSPTFSSIQVPSLFLSSCHCIGMTSIRLFLFFCFFLPSTIEISLFPATTGIYYHALELGRASDMAIACHYN
ncbi:hypothetical protein DFH27DRAFT_197642 [Peziza echinospora]|nr:hypothetical protein DFH27DRAFT_197642 [Peziza echinospora]